MKDTNNTNVNSNNIERNSTHNIHKTAELYVEQMAAFFVGAAYLVNFTENNREKLSTSNYAESMKRIL